MCVANSRINVCGKFANKRVWQMLEEMCGRCWKKCVGDAGRNVCGKCSQKCVW